MTEVVVIDVAASPYELDWTIIVPTAFVVVIAMVGIVVVVVVALVTGILVPILSQLLVMLVVLADAGICSAAPSPGVNKFLPIITSSQ